MIGINLKRAFDKEIRKKKIRIWSREEEIFKCLNKALVCMNGTKSLIIHGQRSIVDYEEKNKWIIPSKKYAPMIRCELGDLMVVCFSLIRKEAKIFVVQNKVNRQRKNDNHKRIKVSLNQFELLSKRPRFRMIRTGDEWDLFNTSKQSSVAVYGNFYKDNNGIDMSVITADKLNGFPGGYTLPKDRTSRIWMTYTGTFDTSTSIAKNRDFCAAKDLISFGDLMSDLRIGRPLNGYGIIRVRDWCNEVLGSSNTEWDGEADIVERLGELEESLKESQTGTNDDDHSIGKFFGFSRRLAIIYVDTGE